MLQIVNIILNNIELYVKYFLLWIVNFLPVKIIRDDKGVPFLYRYHIFSLTNDGPGMCIHRFVKSDPQRGYHDHPWLYAVSFILSGRYEERIINPDRKTYETFQRNRFSFNFLSGFNNYHRVMIKDGEEAWTIFIFSKRAKTWGMINLQGEYYPMSTQVVDNDGGWWHNVKTGYEISTRVPLKKNIDATVDCIVMCDGKILLIERGKEPFKHMWAFPGGRIEYDDGCIDNSAKRELKEETNLEIELKYYKTIGDNKRDPRGFCITNIYVGKIQTMPTNIKAGDDAINYSWFDVKDLPLMAFDHKEILLEYLDNQK